MKHLLSCGDETMAGIVRRVGPLDEAQKQRGRPEDGYGALVRTIVGQQLSTKAARSIYGKLTAHFDGGTPSPEGILAATEDELRTCGLSRPKISYLRDLAGRTLEGDMDFEEMDGTPDEEVIARLTAVKGLGRWSADMFLMFHLRRPDVMPVGDLGIRRAVEKAYALPDMPDAKGLEELSEPWRPERTLAALYLWESLDNAPLET
ncbi:MAG: DNA-3-methyladenine glycosylase 2 family protein [Rubrobacter sp.]|nr:DNA-3-methyladenine glycosylase 2 family protein [Rubrobacter sp.]